MANQMIGILHPGEMGISVAASIQNSGYTVCWASAGRSGETHARAERFGLRDVGTVEALCATCAVIVSVCPPHAAEDVSAEVMGCGFRGVYLDANAISPQRVMRIGQAMQHGGATLVDGGIIGGPAWQAGTTRLYLSGAQAHDVAECFAAGPMQAIVIGDSIGKASALKMCYSAYSKGTTALLCGVVAAAEALRVRADLEGEWARDAATKAEEARQRVRHGQGVAV